MSQTIEVSYTPPSQPNAPGNWTFSPSAHVSIENGAVSQNVYFNLVDTPDWRYLSLLMRRLTIDPEAGLVSSTGFLSVSGTTSKQPYDWGNIYVDRFDDDQIKLEISNHNDSTTDDVVLGVELVIGLGTQQETSQDPQIVLRPQQP